MQTLVIESPTFLYRLLCDIQGQMNGEKGLCVLSEGDQPIPLARGAEVLDVFVPFDVNRKPLLTRITAAL